MTVFDRIEIETRNHAALKAQSGSAGDPGTEEAGEPESPTEEAYDQESGAEPEASSETGSPTLSSTAAPPMIEAVEALDVQVSCYEMKLFTWRLSAAGSVCSELIVWLRRSQIVNCHSKRARLRILMALVPHRGQ